MLGTTAWLATERLVEGSSPALTCLLEAVADRYQVPIVGVHSSLRFTNSRHQELRDFEDGYVKEGVGAGALLFLAQLRGASTGSLLEGCERALETLQAASVGSSA